MFKVLIRPLVESDAETSWKWRNDPEIWKYTESRPDRTISLEMEKQWIQEAITESNSRRFAIMADDVYVGNIQLTNIEEGKNAQYHIFIGDKTYWQKGIASLATAQLIRYARNILNLEALFLYVAPDHSAGMSLYTKYGFKRIDDQIKMTLDLKEDYSPRVSVFMMVYNHESYISDALNGILIQKTNFDFEIVIGEDCSTDGSRRIINEYAQRYPGKFKLLFHPENIGPHKNQEEVLTNCSGEFVAMCEGDDYWTDDLKLNKQVEFLENNPDHNICFHRVDILRNEKIYEDSKIEARFNKINNNPISVTDLLEQGNFMHTPSVVFRNVNLKPPMELIYSSVGDYLLHIINARSGYIKRLDDVMAVYRDGTGIYSSLNSKQQLKKILIYQACIVSYLKDRDQKEIILNKIISNLNKLEYQYTNSGNLARDSSFKTLFKALMLKIKSILIK